MDTEKWPLRKNTGFQLLSEAMRDRPVTADVVTPVARTDWRTGGQLQSLAKLTGREADSFRYAVSPGEGDLITQRGESLPVGGSYVENRDDVPGARSSRPVMSLGLGQPREPYYNLIPTNPYDPGIVGTHEWEHAHQGDEGTGIFDHYDQMANTAGYEIPATLSQLVHKMEGIRRDHPDVWSKGFRVTPGEGGKLEPDVEGNKGALPSLNLVPPESKGEYTVTPQFLHSMAKQHGHLGGNKTITELLATREGQQWLLMMLERSRSAKPPSPPSPPMPVPADWDERNRKLLKEMQEIRDRNERVPYPDEKDGMDAFAPKKKKKKKQETSRAWLAPLLAGGAGLGLTSTAYGMGSDEEWRRATEAITDMARVGKEAPPPGSTRLQMYGKLMSPAASLKPWGIPVTELVPWVRRRPWIMGKKPLAPEPPLTPSEFDLQESLGRQGKEWNPERREFQFGGGPLQWLASALGEKSPVTGFLRKGVGQPSAHITTPTEDRTSAAHYEAFAKGPVPGYAHMLRGYEGGRTVDPKLTGGKRMTTAEFFGPRFDKFVADFTKANTKNNSYILPDEFNQKFMNWDNQSALLDKWKASLNPAERAEMDRIETKQMTNLGYANYQGTVVGANKVRDTLKRLGLTLGGAGTGGLAGNLLYRWLRDDKKENWWENLLATGAGMGLGGVAGHYLGKRGMDKRAFIGGPVGGALGGLWGGAAGEGDDRKKAIARGVGTGAMIGAGASGGMMGGGALGGLLANRYSGDVPMWSGIGAGAGGTLSGLLSWALARKLIGPVGSKDYIEEQKRKAEEQAAEHMRFGKEILASDEVR
jgi:hypothetical protein